MIGARQETSSGLQIMLQLIRADVLERSHFILVPVSAFSEENIIEWVSDGHLLPYVFFRHAPSSRRFFRQAITAAASHREGSIVGDGVRTLIVWAHQEKKNGHLARVRLRKSC